MTTYTGQTRTTLGQVCTALWDSRSRPVVIEPVIEPGSVVTAAPLRSPKMSPSVYSCLLTFLYIEVK